MKKILILGVAAVQMDAIIELKKQGYEVHACAMNDDGPGSKFADYFEVINILDRENIIKYINKNQIDVVYSIGSDLAMPVVSYISEKMNLKKFVSEKTAEICNNKNLMRETLGSNFNGNVKFQVIDNKFEHIQLKFPFIMKPSDSQGQRGVKLVKNLNEFNENFEETRKYSRSGLVILEQYVSGPELSVNGYIVNGKLEYLIISDRDTWGNYVGIIHKHIVPSKNITCEVETNIKSIIENASKVIGITNGPVYAQMKLEEGKPYIIEITPRLDGCHMWKLLTYYTNVNLLKLTFDHLLNDDISELSNFKVNSEKEFVLEFICQEPNTKAVYKNEFNNKIILDHYNYYLNDEIIRAVNGKYEKIGYIIY